MRPGRTLAIPALLFCSLLALSGTGPAQSLGKAEIHSNESRVDLSTGTRTYSGNVVIVVGSFQVEADEVTAYGEGEQITRVIAQGNPARFKQQPIVESGFSHGSAQRIEYTANPTATLVLHEYTLTDARGNVQRGKRATYTF